jgi:hypothetical protein
MRFRILAPLLIAASFSAHPAHALPPRAFSAHLLVGLPHPLNLAGDLRFSPAFTTELALGALKPTFHGKNGGAVTVGVGNLDLRARWHPWDGAFFLGLMLGGQNLSAEAHSNIEVASVSIPVRASLKVGSPYLTPHLGWIWELRTGLTLGVELGWQIPVGANPELTLAIDDPTLEGYLEQVQQTAAYQKLRQDIESVAERLGKVGLPYVTALRIGWAFD